MPRTIDRLLMALSLMALGCWVMMFLSGHDIWHDAGRFDVLQMGATAFDVRAFSAAYYGMGLLLIALAIVTTRAARRPGASA